MDKKSIERFRKKLEREQKAILLSVRRGRIEEEAVEIGRSPDKADVAVDTYQKELEIALQDSEATRLKAVTEALRRIETGQWGLCASCGEPIPATRLAAVPWATKCMRCEDRLENAMANRKRTS